MKAKRKGGKSKEEKVISITSTVLPPSYSYLVEEKKERKAINLTCLGLGLCRAWQLHTLSGGIDRVVGGGIKR